MYNCSRPTSDSEPTENSASHSQLLQGGGALDSGSEPTNNNEQHSHVKGSGQSNILGSLSRVGVRAFSAAYGSTRRSKLQRQPAVCDTSSSAPQKLSADAPERGSVTPAMRKRYLKELLLNNSSGGFGSVAFTNDSTAFSKDVNEEDDLWALSPMEHEWIVNVVDWNYENIMDFISVDSSLLTRKDFVTGYTVLHWLAKSGRDEILIKLLRHAEKVGIPVDVNLKGSGGLTPLHVAAMHSQFMIIKILVGAFSANIDAMDYSGRRAWQYLKVDAPQEIKELLGTWDDEHSSLGQQNTNNNRACSPIVSNSELSDKRDEPAFFDRRWRNGFWSGSFIKLWPSFSLVNKS